MKIKYMMIVGLILAILTIGAVSASEDIDELAGSDGDSLSVDEDDAIVQDGEEEPTVYAEDSVEVSLNKEYYYIINDDDSVLADISAPKNATGKVSVSVGEESLFNDSLTTLSYDVDADDSNIYRYHVKLGNLTRTMFEYSTYFNVKYLGDSYYQPASDQGWVYIRNITDIINFEEHHEYSRDSILWIESYEMELTGNVSINVVGKANKFIKSFEYGYSFSVYANDLNITKYGTYEILVSYISQDGKEKEIKRFNVTCSGYDDCIGLYYSLSSWRGSDYFASIHEHNENYESINLNGTVTVTIDGKKVYNEVINEKDNITHLDLGMENIDLSDYDFTKHHIVVTYMKNNAEKHSVDADVNFYFSPKVYDPEYMFSGEKEAIIINTPKGTSGNATLKIEVEKTGTDDEGNNYTEYVYETFATVKIVDGFAAIPLDKLTNGEYYFSLECNISNDEYSYGLYVTVRDNTPGVTPSISANTITVGDSVTATLKGNASNKKVLVYVDGEEFSRIPFNLGEIIVSLDDLSVGQHYISFKYNYPSQNITYSNTYVVVVKAKQTPITPPIKKDTIKLTLKKVKVKKSAKKLKLTATLKINGKAVKGKTIKFKFNKKTYTAKTDKKGVAKVTIMKKVLKKLKAGKKVTYQATYDKTVKKVTVKVKK